MGIVRYINLEQALDRRRALERCLGQIPRPQWHPQRFSAVGSNDARVRLLEGRCSAAERGCFLSHRTALVQTLEQRPGQHVHMLEDDALLGQKTYEIVDRLLESEEGKVWDIIFTDVIVTRLQAMLELLALRRDLVTRQAVQLIDLSKLEFAGSTSYVVNAAYADRLLYLMNSVTRLDEPVDLLLRRWIWTGKLRACVIFPFVTAVGIGSDSSQIHSADIDLTAKTWNAYRNLVWLERNLETSLSDCQKVASSVQDIESNLMGILCASMSSPHFRLR